MPSIRMTALFVEKVQVPESGRSEWYDTEVPGLTLRVTPSGVKSWSVTYRFKGRPLQRYTIGQYPGVSLKMARDRARDEVRAAVQRGEDPVAKKKSDEREARENGFKDCVDDFVEKYAKPKNRRWEDVKSTLERLAVPAWGDRPVKEIRRRDIADLLDEVAKKTPYQSNHLRAYLSKMFNWLIEREVVESNPVTSVAPRTKPQARSRVLTDVEIAALWKATGRMGAPFGPPIRFLLLTGVRRDEAGCLRWDELDGDWAAMPGSRMKNGRDFRAPLSVGARAILDSTPKLGEYVFTTTGRTPVSGWGRAKERLDELMAQELGEPVAEWRFHDLRRTVATGLAGFGYRREVIDRILAHVPKASDVTSSVYNWNMYDGPAMEAVQKWASHVARVTSGLHVVPAQPVA